MKIKEHKTQILAVLALAFSLGMVIPSAVFASEGTAEGAEAGVSAQAEGGETTDKKEALPLGESIVTLYNRIQERSEFASYRSMTGLIANNEAIAATPLLEDATTWAKNTTAASVGGIEGSVFHWLDSSNKSALSGKKVYQVLDILKTDGDYTSGYGLKSIVDGLETSYTTLRSNEISQIKAVAPTLTGVDTMDFATMVTTSEGFAGYAKNKALYDSTRFLTNTIQSDGSVSLDALKTVYSEAALMSNYNAMAVAASAIDKTVTDGLYAFQLPNTSVGGETDDGKKPSASVPDSGVLGLNEDGSLDLVTLTLIGAASLATVAGVVVLARLYLHRKF